MVVISRDVFDFLVLERAGEAFERIAACSPDTVLVVIAGLLQEYERGTGMDDFLPGLTPEMAESLRVVTQDLRFRCCRMDLDARV